MDIEDRIESVPIEIWAREYIPKQGYEKPLKSAVAPLSQFSLIIERFSRAVDQGVPIEVWAKEYYLNIYKSHLQMRPLSKELAMELMLDHFKNVGDELREMEENYQAGLMGARKSTI